MRTRSLPLVAALLIAACGGPSVTSPVVSPTAPGADPSQGAGVSAGSASAPASAPPATAAPTEPPLATLGPTPTPNPMRIASVECRNGQTVEIHVVLANETGIVSYQVWSTWGGGGETTRSFPTPYRTSVDETFEFTHAIVDPEPSRIHQFGLAVTLAGAADPILTYEIEPGNRCPGH